MDDDIDRSLEISLAVAADQPLSPFEEARVKVNDIFAILNEVESLTTCDNMQYLTRVQRELIFSSLLDNVGALEDVIKAIVRNGRSVRRARLRDDEQLSRIVKALSDYGLRVDQFETNSLVASEYKGDEPLAAVVPSTSVDDDIAAAMNLVRKEPS